MNQMWNPEKICVNRHVYASEHSANKVLRSGFVYLRIIRIFDCFGDYYDKDKFEFIVYFDSSP